MSSLYTRVLCQSKTEAGGRVLTIPKLSLSSDGETSDLSPALLPAPPPAPPLAPPLAPPEYTQMVANLMDFKVTTVFWQQCLHQASFIKYRIILQLRSFL